MEKGLQIFLKLTEEFKVSNELIYSIVINSITSVG